ncbi:craniofacial development protein 2-like [Palaemon carinicauda]|uniref:craniofacial development protein 2-like n=1 Tax=Palaemon carinicauda TaxID=392227 RepID=UPI0035B5D662
MLKTLEPHKRITDWKRPLEIATWNVRTHYKAGSAKVLEHELDIYKIDIAALQEIQWTGIGKLEQEKGVILYSGRDDGNHVEGAGFYLSKRAYGALMEFTPMSSRLAKIRLNRKWFNITILCLHTHTEITDDDEKDEWYDHVQSEIDQIPRHDVLLILGDMNAKIGKGVYAFQDYRPP